MSGQTTQFVYDGNGNLVKKVKPDGSRTIYVGGIYEVDKNSGGTVTKTTVYYPLAGAMRVNGTLYYVLKDHLGSASVVTDNSGNVVGDQRYYPFGATRLASGSMYTDQLFTGQREMAGLGIYHFGARFLRSAPEAQRRGFSPYINRFLSADTVVPNPANPQDFNRYSHVRNNPVRYVDPSGHCIQEGDAPPGSIANRNICPGLGGTTTFSTPPIKPKGSGSGGTPTVTPSTILIPTDTAVPAVIPTAPPVATSTPIPTLQPSSTSTPPPSYPPFVSTQMPTPLPGWTPPPPVTVNLEPVQAGFLRCTETSYACGPKLLQAIDTQFS